MNALRLKKLLHNASDPAYRRAWEQLLRRAQTALAIDYPVSEQERGDWTHYYYCSYDGARLRFDWSRPGLHECPVCVKEWAGEPFDGAWVTLAHSQLGSGMKDLAVYSLVAQDPVAVTRVREVLLAYATYYEGYKVHGNIPYNGPGKLFAQTLDEAHWIIDLCYAYRLIDSHLTDEERHLIQSGLLRPCAAFLISHKEHQLHNHAMLITSAISMLGFLLDDKMIHRAGLEGAYGLLDQLSRGVLDDGMWYEGNFQYHFYGYHSLLQYCILVEGTQWDLLDHPVLKRMFDLPLSYLLPDGTLPNLNDASYAMSVASLAPYYEMAYAWYKDAKYGELLRLAYGRGFDRSASSAATRVRDLQTLEMVAGETAGEAAEGTANDAEAARVLATTAGPMQYFAFEPVERSSMEALWFGEELGREPITDELTKLMTADYTSDISGLTKLVNRSGWHLLVKHSTFGGEHDHMDRLGLSFGVGSVPLFIDPGTTAYGVPAHYGWFKRTYSHNTICLNGKDQPPADGQLLQYRQEPWGDWVETTVNWYGDGYRMKGSIILPKEMCPWDDEVYRGASVRRVNALTDRVLLDIVKVTVPAEREIDLLYHMSGSLEDDGPWQPYDAPVSALSQEWLHGKQSKRHENVESLGWRMKEGRLLQASWCSEPSELITARTPDNPPSGSRQTLIHRVQGTAAAEREVLFIHAFIYEGDGGTFSVSGTTGESEAADGLKLQVKSGEGGELLISLSKAKIDETWSLEWIGDKAALTFIR
ncbi:heparinase II/III family protein [Paenibacillus filicis]|uniref:Heparinase II/III family protein n=1 Tax=Paenibacillus gyeongsangnamensis TaxID=3388067 RepID=A0ABT4QIR8_9BACL|nr:heparinase II/III family protein [Paenibacillus filicis]MCZ8516580.1 heparinase II/III family protein [Paenibacillus filicis]